LQPTHSTTENEGLFTSNGQKIGSKLYLTQAYPANRAILISRFFQALGEKRKHGKDGFHE
jgi:hypothetical protein